MPVLRSRLDPASPEAVANLEAMTALVADLRARTAAVASRGAGGDERSITRHRERGKIPVRERIDRILDPGAPFLELSALAANGMYDDEAALRADRLDREDQGACGSGHSSPFGQTVSPFVFPALARTSV